MTCFRRGDRGLRAEGLKTLKISAGKRAGVFGAGVYRKSTEIPSLGKSAGKEVGKLDGTGIRATWGMPHFY